jgi:hypothetical protein
MLVAVVVLLLWCSQLVQAQLRLDYYLPTASATLKYNADVPTPEAFFGFQVGEWHLQPEQVNSYLQALAQRSKRFTIKPYARSHEQRPLLLAIVSSPNNIANLEQLQRQHRTLADPTQSQTLNVETMPVVTWLGYTVHGNEPSGLNAVPLVAYFLAAAESAELDALLANSIIVLDPCLNPDGAARFAQWANIHRGVNVVADPQHREHNEGWLTGRYNHYWFDPNRDWMPLQHPESRGRLEQFYQWMPNVLTDHHEMGGNNAMFFFQPAAPTRNNPHTPEKVFDFTRQLAKFHARSLDSVGTLYFTKEYFDDFYVGKGATYGDVTGSVAILFEQGSSRGHAQESSNGVLTFASTIRNQVLASFSTLRGALSLRKELLAYQRSFFATAAQEAEKSPTKAYVLGSNDAARNYHFLDVLRRHQIQVYELAKSTTLEGKRFEAASAFVIPTAQPQHRLLTALFEKRTTFQDSVFYDISAWSLPLAFDMTTVEMKSKPSSDLQGKLLTQPTFPKGQLLQSAEQRASRTTIYAFSWEGYYAPRALGRLLKAGCIAKVATKPFEALTAQGKQRFGYGSILIPTGIQQEQAAELQQVLETIAREDALTIHALQTGLAESGVDVGSRNVVAVQPPRILLVVGEGVSPTDAGEIWHLLDNKMGFELSIAEHHQLSRIDLSRYTTILLPNGRYAAMSKGSSDALKAWVENGGVLIGVEEAVQWLASNELLRAEQKRPPNIKDIKEEPQRRDYAMLDQDAGAQNLDGAIFSVTLDPTHPVGYGYESRSLAVFRSNRVFLEPAKNPYATPLAYTASPLLSGYIWRDHEKLLKNSADVLVSTVKSGRVIGFTSNPNFRGFWFGTNKLFLNAVLFGHTINANASLWGGKIEEN